MKIFKYKQIKFPENLPKYALIDFQIWFPKYKFKNSKYIKHVEAHSLRSPEKIVCVDIDFYIINWWVKGIC